MFTYWIELFHRDRFVVKETFVHGAEASLSQSAAAVWDGSVIEVARDPHQLIVEETGEADWEEHRNCCG